LSHLPPLGEFILDIPSGESALTADRRPARFDGFGQTFTGENAENGEDYDAGSKPESSFHSDLQIFGEREGVLFLKSI
jgi:hypothetical protein